MQRELQSLFTAAMMDLKIKERLGRFQAFLFPLLPLGKMKHLGARLREVLDCQALRKGGLVFPT